MRKKLTFVLLSLVLFIIVLTMLALLNNNLKNQDTKVINAVEKKTEIIKLELPFKNGSFIQKIYTCDGSNINPYIKIPNFNKLKEKGKYLAILVIDPDAPLGTFTHWKAWNIKITEEIPENSSRKGLYEEGINDFGYLGYGGPCPPKGEIHHYYFYVYLLNETVNFDKNVNWQDFKKILEEKAIAKGVYVGLYKRG